MFIYLYLKDFILNILILFSPIVVYPYIYKTKSKLLLFRFLIFILFSIALVTTMSFPINMNGLIYDFRSIPLTIGSLYGGIQVSLLLYATLAIFRSFIGDHELIYAISLLPSLVLVILFLRKYSSLRTRHKVVAAVVLCSLTKMTTFTTYLLFTKQLHLLFIKPSDTILTYALQGIIAGLFVYLIEFLNHYYYMQEEVIKSEKIKIVSEMAASVAHEIRNPLTAVRGFIQLIAAKNINEEKKNYYQKICLEELDRAQLIITDYLSLAKPDLDKIETMNLNDEIQYLTNVLLTYANYNNIQIQTNPFDGPPLYICGDRHKFRQAVINIGKNAIEAMHHGGQLDFKVDKMNHQIVLYIMDTGVGMTEEQIKRLGTPYYSTKEKGTGLGTMVSFGIIKKMNGKIEVQSVIGEGTKYTLSFPEASGT